jgi:alcohol dehydrogenase (cytochrome c)/quinohemoprotein ethanol dehydrogenase
VASRLRALAMAAVSGVALAGAAVAADTTTSANTIPANVTAQRLLHADAEPSQWLTYGGDYNEQRYSRLTAINRENVKQLGLTWFADYDTNLSQDGTPLYIDGVIYVSTAWTKVYAFDAATGKTLWEYDPKTPGEWIRNVCCGIVNRGIAAYQGKIYLGTLDGRLVALDARDGKEVWSTLTVDKSKHYSITSAPRIAKGKVFLGVSGGEYGIRGYISAYDADTGKMLWRFYTVPGNPADGFENQAMKKAAATWGPGDWWKLGGGGAVWDAIVYDPKTDLLYFGTGNGSPWNDKYRDPTDGDNLYLDSIIAVKPDTGEYVWHYQATPADTWDYDAVSPMTVADIKLDGKKRHVILQACKNGFFYVLDAPTGKLLRATPFTPVNWADGVDMKTGRPRTKPESRYPVGHPWNLEPGVQGAHGWQANAYSPDTGLLYFPTQLAYFPMVADPKFTPNPVGYNLGLDFAAPFTYYKDHPDQKAGFASYLQAWDPVTGKQVWRGEDNQGPTGGALATASGLIFHAGGSSNEVRAYDAKTGEKLWKFATQTGSVAPPIAFQLDGQEYIALSVGGNTMGGYYAPNYSRMLVFGLGGDLKLPPAEPYTPPPLDPPPSTASADVIKTGEQTYAKFCAACHGDRGATRGANFPDLTRSPLLNSQEAFDAVVLKGIRSTRGMASFASELQPEDTQALRAYIIDRANEVKKALAAAPPPGAPGVSQPHQ